MTRDGQMQTRSLSRRFPRACELFVFCASANGHDATLHVTADVDGQTQMHPSKVAFSLQL